MLNAEIGVSLLLKTALALFQVLTALLGTATV